MGRRMQLVAILLGASCWLAGCPRSTGGQVPECVPECTDKECGSDGCQGQCGQCEDGWDCCGGTCCLVGPPVDTREEPEPWWEILVPDGSVEDVCNSIFEQYHSLLAQAGTCETPLDCSHPVENRLACTCPTYVSDPTVEPGLAELTALHDENNCLEGVACGACPWLEVPTCKALLCSADTPLCVDVPAIYQEMAALARGCESDAECTGAIPLSLDCTCEVPANGKAWVGYFDILLEYWTTSECGMPAPCDCDDTGVVGCVDGQCGYKPAAGEGSKVCEMGEDCTPVSGCACGCWSEPPPEQGGEGGQECPCAAPESCVCHFGQCKSPHPGSQACQNDDDCFPMGGCDCGCWSQAPVNETTDIDCDCEAPASCSCKEGVCEGGW